MPVHVNAHAMFFEEHADPVCMRCHLGSECLPNLCSGVPPVVIADWLVLSVRITLGAFLGAAEHLPFALFYTVCSKF